MDASTRKTPKIEAPSAERIPPEMLGEDRWILWTYWRDKNGTLKKPPVDVVTGRHCSGTDRANWMSWAEAQEAARKSGGKWGVGFALGAGWSGIDLDDCIVEIDGKQRLAEWSERIVKPNGEIQSYAEISPSGTGVKIFVRDPLEASKTHSPDGACCIETYGKDRYFATTGRRMKGAPEEVREAPETVSATLLQAVAWKNQSEGRKAERAKQAGQGNTAAPSGGDRAEERMAAKKATTPVRVDDDRGAQEAVGAVRHVFSGGRGFDPQDAIRKTSVVRGSGSVARRLTDTGVFLAVAAVRGLATGGRFGFASSSDGPRWHR